MIEQRLVDYIKKYMSLKHSKDTILNRLLKDGWTKEEIKEAFSVAERETEVEGKEKGKKRLIIIISVVLIIILVWGIFLLIDGQRPLKKWAFFSKPTLSCLEQFGMVCIEGERCPGKWLKATDSSKCCSVACV